MQNPKYLKYLTEAAAEDNEVNVSVDATEVDEKANNETDKQLNITPTTIKDGKVKEELGEFFDGFNNGSAKTTLSINSKTITIEIVVKDDKVGILSAEFVSLEPAEAKAIKGLFKKSEMKSDSGGSIKVFIKKSMSKEEAIDKIDSALNAIAFE